MAGLHRELSCELNVCGAISVSSNLERVICTFAYPNGSDHQLHCIMGHQAILHALGYPRAQTFNQTDSQALRNLVVWLENVKVHT